MAVDSADSGSSPAAAAVAGGAMMAAHSLRLSTVVPASVTGEDVNYELADADLLHKLHYLRAVHVFRAPAALTIRQIKEPMFPWLDMYFPVSARLRRRDVAAAAGESPPPAGRPYLRCNDCGVRIVEADCDATVDEWLEEAAAGRGDLCKALAHDKVIGPELFFSPLLYVQITRFKCGGMALGFTWAHVIGDIPSAAACFSRLGQFLSGKTPPAPTLRDPSLSTPPPSATPASVKAAPPPSVRATAAPVGDHWVVPTSHEMALFSFHVTEQQLKGLQLSAPAAAAAGGDRQVGPFELVSALLWRALAEVRGPEEEQATRTVTVVKADVGGGRLPGLSNEHHRIGHVVAAAGSAPPPATAGVAELAALLAGARLDEARAVAAAALGGAGDADVVVYGANPTFVDAGALDVYGALEIAGRRPAHVEYAVDGVGDGGAAVVHRDAGGRGRTVAAVVRRGEAGRLRAALRDALRGVA